MPLFTGLPFNTFQKIGRLALWTAVFISELQFAETQVEDMIDGNRLSRSLRYDDITPYLYTHSGEYLQAIDAYDKNTLVITFP